MPRAPPAQVPRLTLGMTAPAFAADSGDRVVMTLCPGGKERMRRLIEMVRR